MGLHCDHCHKPIVGRVVKAFGKNYHPDHLLCAVCGQPILTDRFFEHDGKPYCFKDHEQFLPKCQRCNEAITGTGITTNGKEWHKDCFICDRCGAKLAGRPFYEDEGQFLCEKCKRKTSPQCAGCNKPIETEDLEALGKHWHPKCFICSKCKKPIITNQFSVTPEGDPLCVQCSVKDI